MDYLVDANSLLDLFTVDPIWCNWSRTTIIQCSAQGTVAINPVVYAEISIRFATIAELEAAIPPSIAKLDLPCEAAFLAGKCFREYRKRGGTRTSPLPDFFIGAHAEIAGMELITRDPARYRTYFPKLKLICPS